MVKCNSNCVELEINLIDMKEIILKQLVLNRTLDTCNDFVLWADISDLEVLADKIEKAITVTQCCKSDSEQLSKRPNTSSTWECFSKEEKQQKGNI